MMASTPVNAQNCMQAAPGINQWQNASFAAQSGRFTAMWDAIPLAANADVLLGLSQGPQTNWSGLAAIVRFNTNNTIDARNGGVYSALTSVAYVPNASYRIRMEVDVAAHRYSVFVTPESGTEQVIARDFAFRTEQQGVTSLDNAVVEAEVGGIRACNLTVSNCKAASPGAQQWQNVGIARQTGAFTAQWDATPTTSSGDTLIALSQGPKTNWTGLAAIVRFNSNNTFDARNGDRYAADSVISYVPNSTYRIRMEVNVATHRYSAYVTPPGGSEQLLAWNYAFRTEQQGVTSLDNAVAEAEVGGLQACSLMAASWAGTKQFGSSRNESSRGASVDSVGNVYVTGVTEGGIDGNANAGMRDIFITKFAADGRKHWLRQFGTPYQDEAGDIRVDAKGEVFISGTTRGVFDSTAFGGDGDIFLAKYDRDGNKIWTRMLGSPYQANPGGMAFDALGNIFMGGAVYGSLDGNAYAGYSDALLVKFDANGNKQWVRQFGTALHDSSSSVVVDSVGDVYISGSTDGALEGNVSAGRSDILVARFRGDGSRVWLRQTGSPQDESGSIALGADGRLYIGGYTNGTFDGNPNMGSTDFLFVQYDTNGNKGWSRTYGTAGTDIPGGIVADSLGGLYLSGWTREATSTSTEDMLLVKYDTSGNRQWVRRKGGPASEVLTATAVDGADVVVAGYANVGVDGNQALGDNDVAIVKYAGDGTQY